jgi:muramoyltetrapeptide carboxypeptidase
VAPASPFDAALVEAGRALLEGWGLRVRSRDDIGARAGYLAGSPERRAAELHDAWDDPDARLIVAARGGYGVSTILPLLDRGRLARGAPVIGCSDLTALLVAIVGSGGVGIHGPMAEGLGRMDDPEGTERLRQILFSADAPGELRSRLPDATAWCLSPGVARGRALGGSLTLLSSLCGTPFQPDTRGAVLFLEDVGERPYRLDRMLVQLEQSGLFAGCRAVVLGDFTRCDEPGGALTWRDAAVRVFRRRALPVLAGLPFGHGRPNLPIPMGTEVEVDAGAGVLRFREGIWTRA